MPRRDAGSRSESRRGEATMHHARAAHAGVSDGTATDALAGTGAGGLTPTYLGDAVVYHLVDLEAAWIRAH